MYIPEALWSQWKGGGYDYGGVTGLRAALNGKGWLWFNVEQQAQIIEDGLRDHRDNEIIGIYSTYRKQMIACRSI